MNSTQMLCLWSPSGVDHSAKRDRFCSIVKVFYLWSPSGRDSIFVYHDRGRGKRYL